MNQILLCQLIYVGIFCSYFDFEFWDCLSLFGPVSPKFKIVGSMNAKLDIPPQSEDNFLLLLILLKTHGIIFFIFFKITALCLVEELMSPIITPFVLLLMVHPRAGKIVDFFRNFTVDVTGVGDICSFAQMDVRRHGNPAWQQQGDNNDLEPDQPSGSPKSNKSNVDAYSQAEAGKTEMSLINFTLANPDWKPPNESKEFINALRGHATKDIKTLSVLDEEKFESNPLYSSLTALENVGGIYTEIAQNLLMSTNLVSNQAPPQINLFGAAHSELKFENKTFS